MVISVRNEKGEELSRQVVAVGALRAHEERTVSLTVEMFAAGGGQGTPRGGGKR